MGLIREADGGQAGTKTIERTKVATKRPSFYVVVLHNDDFTPRGFVVHCLEKLFGKTEPEAIRIMKLAHNFGVGAVGSYAHEIAEAKAEQGIRYARDNGYPLMFSVQKED